MNEELDIEDVAPGLVLFFTLAGGVLRLLLLNSKSMWLDETFSVWMAGHSLPDMLHWIVQIDQHPPLYYGLLHYWMMFTGDTPRDVRLLSVLFGTATIPVMYWIGKRIVGQVAGVAAAMFMALSLFNVFYAQEARMYTLLTFNASLAIYALVRLLTNPRSVRPIGSQFWEALRPGRTPVPVEPAPKKEFSYRDESAQTGWRTWFRWASVQGVETDLAWVGFIVFSALTLLTHNTAVLFLFTINVFVLGLMLFQHLGKSGPQPAFQAPSLWNWVKAQVGIFLLWSPWLSAFLQQARRVDQQFWIPSPTWDAVLQTLKTFLNDSTPNRHGMSDMVLIVYVLILLLGLWHFRKKLSQFLFLAVLFILPFAAELLISLRRPIYSDRTLIWTTIPLFLVLAAGITQLKFRPLILVTLISLGALNLFSDGDYFRFYQKEDWDTPAGYVANFAEKDDLVLFNSNFVVVSFDYYFKPYKEKYSIEVVERGLPLDLYMDGVLEPKMTRDDVPALLALIQGHKRVWLVYSHDWYTDPLGLIPQTLASQMKVTREREFYGGRVILYEARE